MFKPIRDSTEELKVLLNTHLGDSCLKDATWQVLDSPISGRGLFAQRDIAAGETVLREHALVIGPTANLSYNLKTCCVCYCHLEGSEEQIMCKNGCSLPVCDKCFSSDAHARECQLFCTWQPKNKANINRHSLRLLSLTRCLFLDDLQSRLLYALQGNPDKYYMLEIQKGSECFEKFPHDQLRQFYRIACTFNTNAFEGRSCVEDHEVLIRALFPLAALMNHQCTPNVNHHLENGDTLVVTAVRPIAKGEEIVTCYTKLLWSTFARKIFLAMTKKFICTCKRCLDPTVSDYRVNEI